MVGAAPKAQAIAAGSQKLHAKVKLAPPAGAVVSAELLLFLREEVGKKPASVEAIHVQAQPQVSSRQPRLTDDVLKRVEVAPSLAPPAPSATKTVTSRHAAGGKPGRRQLPPPLSMRDAAVITDEADECPAPPGTKHASVGTVEVVEEGTQTICEKEEQVSLNQSPAKGQPVLLSPQSQKQTFQSLPTQHLPVLLSPANRVAVLDSQRGAGLGDLLDIDRISLEKERERRRLQAQMLADQIEEQRLRKEEEKRKRKEEEFVEEQRLVRERKEIQDRLDREEKARRAASEAAMAVYADSQASPSAPSKRRFQREEADVAVSPNHRSAFRGTTTTAADSTAGPWAEATERRRARRRTKRRPRETADSIEGGAHGTWRTAESKRTWRDPNLDSFSLRTQGRDADSPTPSEFEQDGLSTVQEASDRQRETHRHRSKHRHRMERDRDRTRVTNESHASQEPWTAARNPPRLQSEDAGASDARPWMRAEDGDDPALVRDRGRRQRPHMATEEASNGIISDVRDRREDASRITAKGPLEMDLKEQIGSLVRVCEQLLLERAEAASRYAGPDAAARQLPSIQRKAVPNNNLMPSGQVPQQYSLYNSPKSVYEASYNRHHAKHAGALAAASSNLDTADLSWEDHRTSLDDGDAWPPDALVELLQKPLLEAEQYQKSSHLQQAAQHVSGTSAAISPTAAACAPPRDRTGAAVHQPPVAVAGAFASPVARGLALRRVSGAGLALGPAALATPSGLWPGRIVSSPTPMSRGGLNVQAHWPGLCGPNSPVAPDKGCVVLHPSGHKEPSSETRHGPIGIRPLIQAQSAMLREMYPHGIQGP